MENELCYYCNLSTFKSIIENQTFWLSDIHFMNDSSEESLFLDALTDLMRKMRENLSDSTKEYLNNKNFMDSFFTNIKYNYKNMVYICCFTDEKNDDLSQWRGYADDGKGLCIGFKKEHIKELSNNKIIKKHTIDFKNHDHIENVSTSVVFAQMKIIYSEKAEIMKELEEKIVPLVNEYDTANKKVISPPFPDSLFTIQLYNKIYNYKVFYKNKSFKSEDEYRICFYDNLHEEALEKANISLIRNMQAKYEFNNKITLSELKYRIGRERLIPYREMKFPLEYFKEMLSSITIGPKNPMSIKDVKYFLIANGFDTSNITIQKSASSYQ